MASTAPATPAAARRSVPRHHHGDEGPVIVQGRDEATVVNRLTSSAGTLNDVSTIPSGSNRPKRAIHSSGPNGGGGQGAPSVISPSSASASASASRIWIRARRSHHQPEPQADGQQDFDGDTPIRRHGVVEWALQGAQDRRPANSGRSSSTGSQSVKTPSSTRSMVAAAAIGLVREAMRKMASWRSGAGSPTASNPALTSGAEGRGSSALANGSVPAWRASKTSSACCRSCPR